MMDHWLLHPGPSRIPDAAAPDVRARSYRIRVEVELAPGDGGVLLSHGDRHAGYALRIADGRLVHHHAQAGRRDTFVSASPVPVGRRVEVGVRVTRVGPAGLVELMVDGVVVGAGRVPLLATARTGWSGVDVGSDRGLTVGPYAAPARFSGWFSPILVEADDDQCLDESTVWVIEDVAG